MDKEEVREAVELLVGAHNYTVLKKELRDIIATKGVLPRRFAGDLVPLNALVTLEGISKQAFENVADLVEERRKAEPATAKVDYMRSYMLQQRTRLRTALCIEELERGKRLSPAARGAFKKARQAQWMKARDAHIAAQGWLTWQERNTAAGVFWRRIDTQLEQRLVDAKLKIKR